MTGPIPGSGLARAGIETIVALATTKLKMRLRFMKGSFPAGGRGAGGLSGVLNYGSGPANGRRVRKSGADAPPARRRSGWTSGWLGPSGGHPERRHGLRGFASIATEFHDLNIGASAGCGGLNASGR